MEDDRAYFAGLKLYSALALKNKGQAEIAVRLIHHEGGVGKEMDFVDA